MTITEDQDVLLGTAFRPHAPIIDEDSFIGRVEELSRVKGALTKAGLHVVLYGERGSGKTSLANVATSHAMRLQVFCEEDSSFASLLKDAVLRYQEQHPEHVVYDATTDSIELRGAKFALNNLTGSTFLQIVGKAPLSIIFDELDRIQKKIAIKKLAELTKNAATFYPHLTLILVGVSDTANDLLAGHKSNFRNLRQVQLGRMSNPELNGILDRGASILGLTFADDVRKDMIALCDQMPYYLHLLATSAATAALNRNSKEVAAGDLLEGTITSAEDVDEKLRDAYEVAILSEKGSLIYRRVIWAMASLNAISNNVSAIAAVTNELALSEGGDGVTTQAIGGALKRLTTADKQAIVVQATPGTYKFSDALMKGFVLLMRHGK